MFYTVMMGLIIVLTISGLVANLFGSHLLATMLLAAPAGWAMGGCFAELVYRFSK